jgi:4-hydroxybenzoyl-CoA thioesterase/acyl-CoA thioester hydrolase
MAQTFTHRRRVEFRDTDAAGIVHFSVFFAYMEQAEHEFLRSRGVRVIQQFEGRTISWPRVRAECDFRKPARFEDELEIDVQVARVGEKSVSYAFVFRRGSERLADGKIVAACCEVEGCDIKSSVPVPEAFRQALLPFCVELDPR